MTLHRLLLLASLCLPSTLVQAAGFSLITIPADQQGPSLRGAVWSPCSAPATDINLGPVLLKGVRNCPMTSQQRPLIVISHGSGGSFLGHHDTAEALADAGFVVAAINHPGDNFQDLSRQASLSAFATRPLDMRRLVDYLLTSWPNHGQLNPDKIGLFGFSRGGYTGLVAAGATPNWTLRQDLCPDGSTILLCQQISRHQLPPPPLPDARIKVVVIVDPLTVFDSQGLKQLQVPIQLWASDFGGDGVTPQSVRQLRRDLPQPPEWHVASGATHFAFLAPCSAAMARVAPDICQDHPGFDRSAFHAQFNAQVVRFFSHHLM